MTEKILVSIIGSVIAIAVVISLTSHVVAMVFDGIVMAIVAGIGYVVYLKKNHQIKILYKERDKLKMEINRLTFKS